MLVKIIKSTGSHSWYAGAIGSIVDVESTQRHTYDHQLIHDVTNLLDHGKFIRKEDFIVLTEREVLLYEAEQAQKEFEAARCRFQEYERKNTITERDIVPGAKFTGKRKSLYVMINHVSRKDPYGKFLIGGAYGDPFITYSDDPKTRVEMVEHLIVLGAKKVENEI